MELERRRWLGMAAGMITGGLLARTASGQEKGGRGLTFEVYKDAKSEFRWRLKAGNGQIIGTSGQGYKDRSDCKHAIELIQKGAASAKIEDDVAGKK